MERVQDFIDNAAECVRMAQVSRDDHDRQTWLDMAASYMRRAKNAIPNDQADLTGAPLGNSSNREQA